jgi:hypothetical protein
VRMNINAGDVSTFGKESSCASAEPAATNIKPTRTKHLRISLSSLSIHASLKIRNCDCLARTFVEWAVNAGMLRELLCHVYWQK